MRKPSVRLFLRFAATIGPPLVVVFFGLLAYSAARFALNGTARVARTYEATVELSFVLQRLVDAETAQRGYLITGDTAFLAGLHGVDAEVWAALAHARGLIRSRTQRARLAQLEPTLRHRLDLIGQNIAVRREAGMVPANLDGRLAHGRAVMDSVRERIAVINAMQTTLLNARRAREQAAVGRFNNILLVGTIGAGLLALLTNLLFSRAARIESLAKARLQEQADELAEQNRRLEEQAVELEVQAVELEEAAETARENEERFRALIENTSDVISIASPAGVILYRSPSTERVFGRSVASMLGTDGFGPVHPDDVARVREEFGAAVRERGSRRLFEYRYSHADGSWRNVETVVHNLMGVQGVDGVVATTRDITERRRAEDALRKSQEQLVHAQKMEAVGRLAGGIAHDFNNLLTIINGNVEMLLAEGKGLSARDELNEVAAAGERARSLTRQLLAFSRKQIISPVTMNLNDVVRSTERMLSRVIGEDIELRTRLAPDLDQIEADPGQVDQILMNLVINARDAMPHGGGLTIETRNAVLPSPAEEEDRDGAETRCVLLAVSDSGTGMDRPTQARIFEPFFTTKPAGKGTGLGLSTVYGIVKQSGGDVRVYSELGKGTTLKIYFPAASESQPKPGPVRVAELAAGTASVLVVEDEPGVRKLAERILQRAGYRVQSAATAEEAITIAEQCGYHIDLLITDVVMPGLSGRGLADELVVRIPGLRVIYMSGYTDDAIVHHGVLDANIDFLEKPFSQRRLLLKVQEVLQREAAPT